MIDDATYRKLVAELDGFLTDAGILRAGETAAVIGMSPYLDSVRQAYLSARLSHLLGPERAIRTMRALEANHSPRSSLLSAAEHNIAAGMACARRTETQGQFAPEEVFERIIGLFCGKGLLIVRPADAGLSGRGDYDYAQDQWERMKSAYQIKLINTRVGGFKFHAVRTSSAA